MDPNACFARIIESLVSLNVHVHMVSVHPGEARIRRHDIAAEYANLNEAAQDLREWLDKGGFAPSLPGSDASVSREFLHRMFAEIGRALQAADQLAGEVYGEPVRKLAWSHR